MIQKRAACILIVILVFASFAGVTAQEEERAEETDSKVTFSNAQFSTLETYGEERMGAMYMRGFAVSKDGKYLYVGLVHGENGLFRLNTSDGSYDGTSYYDKENGMIKGIATDDRGYVYIGITSETAEGSVSIACLDRDLNELTYETIEIDGKIGINGVEVDKKEGRYYMYFITNYDVNTIRCYDVTDPGNIFPVKEFGINGVLYLDVFLGSPLAQGNYLKIDEDGSIYMTANMNMFRPKGDTVLKIDKDWKRVQKIFSLDDAYGIHLYKDYVFVSRYGEGESNVYILDKNLKVIEVVGWMPGCANYSGVAVANGRIYIADQLFMGIDRIIVSEVIDDLVEPSHTRLVLRIVLISIGVVVAAVVVYSVKKIQKMLR
ncbi:MAG: hypothetical protein GX166_07950 [Clostridiaceae bacterium]|nr:hypothetical protein [Clostridiaceae bacterium]